MVDIKRQLNKSFFTLFGHDWAGAGQLNRIEYYKNWLMNEYSIEIDAKFEIDSQSQYSYNVTRVEIHDDEKLTLFLLKWS